jgi:hypothetical protein
MAASCLNCFEGDPLKSNWPTSDFPNLEMDLSFYFSGGLVRGGRDYCQKLDFEAFPEY